MRPAEVTDADIISAGQALMSEDRPVTGFGLRQRLGGGNAQRLKAVWDEHQARSAETTDKVADLPVEVAQEAEAIAKELSSRIAALAVALNDRAVRAAERRVAEVIRTAGEQRQQAERELVDASTEVDQLEKRLASATAETDAVKQQFAAAQQHGHALELELAQLRERLSAAETDAAAAAAARTELDAARHEAATLAGRLAEAQSLTAALIAKVGNV